MIGTNKTTVAKTGIGAGFAILIVFIIGKTALFAEPLSAEDGAIIVGALTSIFNWLIPADWKPFGKK